jgi:hypothetical protein
LVVIFVQEHGRVKVDATNYYSVPLLYNLLLNFRLNLVYVAQVDLLSQGNILRLSEHSLVNHRGILILNQLAWNWFVDLGLSDLVNLLHLQLLNPEELRNGQDSVASEHFVAAANVWGARHRQTG